MGLTNNDIFKKLRVAHKLRDEDIIKTDEGLIFNPYNPLNTEITLSDVQFILTKYGLPAKIFNIEFNKFTLGSDYSLAPIYINNDNWFIGIFILNTFMIKNNYF